MAAGMALWTAVAFIVYLWVAKEIRLLYVHEPWQNDPYDAVVSFAFFFVPILAALCLTRAAMCKSAKPLPVRRVRELLIASRLMLAIAGVTLAAEWMSVALGVDRRLWNPITVVMLVPLGLLTLAVAVTGVVVIGALRGTPAAERGPDWWSDASAVIDEYWQPGLPLGEVLPRFIKRVIDRGGRTTRVRPIATAAIVSIAFGGLLATSQGLAEGGFAPPVFTLYMSVAAASMLAFLLIVGAHLRFAGERPRMTGRSRRFAELGGRGRGSLRRVPGFPPGAATNHEAHSGPRRRSCPGRMLTRGPGVRHRSLCCRERVGLAPTASAPRQVAEPGTPGAGLSTLGGSNRDHEDQQQKRRNQELDERPVDLATRAAPSTAGLPACVPKQVTRPIRNREAPLASRT